MTDKKQKDPESVRTAVLEGDGYTLYNQSCLQMPQISDNRVSLVLTDPPYFIDGMDDRWDNKKLQKRVKPGVVGGIPAGQRFDPRQGVRLQQFLTRVAEECFRVLKPGGFMLCFGQPRLIHRTAMALELSGFEIRDVAAWRYEGQAKAFSQDHFVRKMNIAEHQKQVIIKELAGRKTPQLKPRMELIVIGQKPKEGTFVDNWLKYKTGLINVRNPVLEPGSFPANVIGCPKPRNKHSHMTVKPLDLCRHLVRIFSSVNDVVLDPFLGTGTTAVAALAEGRKCLGYELDNNMMKVIKNRINEKSTQASLAGTENGSRQTLKTIWD